LTRKIDARELLAAIGGLLVLISLFLEWYAPGGGARSLLDGGGLSAWEAFEALDLVLAALALTAIATGAAALGASMALGPRALMPLGAALLIVVIVQLASPPPVAWNADLGTGAWLALGGSFLVLLGGLLRAARIDVTVSVGARDARRRVPAVDRRPGAAEASDRARRTSAAAASASASADEGNGVSAGNVAAAGARRGGADIAGSGASRGVGAAGERAGSAGPRGDAAVGEAAPRRSLLDEPDDPQATQPFKPVDGEA
jgi:hypothetical protein